jgi:hypothetical protein
VFLSSGEDNMNEKTLSSRLVSLALVLSLASVVHAARSDGLGAKGPLRVHPENPRYFNIAATGQGEGVWPEEQWQSAAPEEVGLDFTLLAKARDYALSGAGSGMIVRHGNPCPFRTGQNGTV